MSFAKKRLRGLAALITAAAAALTSLPMTAAADVTNYVTAEQSGDTNNQTYNVKVYETSFSKLYDTPVFEFETDSSSKYFPTKELEDGNYLPLLQLCYTSAADNVVYYSMEYDNCNYKNMKSGEVFWDFVNAMAELEQGKGAAFSIDNLNVYLYKPSITLNISRDGLDYKFFSDGKITADENKYIAERSAAGDVWKISHGNISYKYTYTSGDKLAEFVWDKAINDIDGQITLSYIDTIYIVNKLGNDLSLIGSEDSDANGPYRNVINENIGTYTFGTAPISIEDAARSVGLASEFQTPTEWTLCGIMFWGNDDCYAYMANESKNNVGLDSAEVFNFDNNLRNYFPILMISKVESKKYEIPCSLMPDGKLVYTIDEHSAFPTMDGIDEWVFSYDGDTYTVTDSNGLWNVISNEIVLKGKAYDSTLAVLSPSSAWYEALLNADTSTGDTIITAPAGDRVVPKYIFEAIRNDPGQVIIKFSDGISWGIKPTTIDLYKMPDNGVDLSVIFSENLSTAVQNVKNTQYKTEVSFKHTGDFGFAATLFIDLSEHMKNAPAGEYIANYFVVSSDTEMQWEHSYKLDQSNITSHGIRRANKLAIIVCRDKLDGSVIREAEISITAPAKGGDAAEAPTVTGGAAVDKFTWSPAPADGKFAANTAYTLSVYLKAAENTSLSKYLTATVNGSAANVTADENGNVIVTYKFRKTAGGSSGGGGSSSGGGGGSSREQANPDINGKSMSWADIAAELAKLAIGSEVTISLNGNYSVPVEVIKAIADRSLKATFVVDSWRSWYLDGAKVEAPAAADMTILQIASLDSSALRGTVGVKFHLNGTNNPTEFRVSFKKDYAGRFANLYRKDGDKLVFVGVSKVDANGAAAVSVSDKSDYVIMLCEYSDLSGDISNDGVLSVLDASAILKKAICGESGANPLMADFNGDGEVDLRDALEVLKLTFGVA